MKASVSYLSINHDKKMIYKVQDQRNRTIYFTTTFDRIFPLIKNKLIKSEFEVFEVNEL